MIDYTFIFTIDANVSMVTLVHTTFYELFQTTLLFTAFPSWGKVPLESSTRKHTNLSICIDHSFKL